MHLAVGKTNERGDDSEFNRSHHSGNILSSVLKNEGSKLWLIFHTKFLQKPTITVKPDATKTVTANLTSILLSNRLPRSLRENFLNARSTSIRGLPSRFFSHYLAVAGQQKVNHWRNYQAEQNRYSQAPDYSDG